MSQGPRTSAGGSLVQLFLRYAAPLSGLRRLPLLGPLVGWASGQLLPRDTLTWAQVQRGPAKGLWLRLNPRTGGAYFAGAGEPAVQAALQQHLRPGMTFYDIGANIGFFSLLAARLVGPQGCVVAFEADPEIAVRLQEHLARNHFPWASAAQQAIWSEPTTVFFARTDPDVSPDRGLGRVVPELGESTIQVRATSLDEFARGARPPEFIKCDVEGAEVEVIRGARKLLAEQRPGILCELHSEQNRAIVLSELASYRYTCTALDQNHILALPQ